MTTYRAAAIGDTGRGNYGHAIDLAWVGLPGVQYVAVADEDATGRHAAGVRTGAQRQYADYREMLEHERPDFVSVCPRWVDRHAEMVQACAAAGVRGVLLEKPMAGCLAECDAMLAACERAGTQLAVAHGRRFDPWVQRLRALLADGRIGPLRSISTHGKGDQRGGAEDLLVLGTHVLDLARLFAGEVAWAWGRVTQGGRDLEPGDVIDGAEGMGPSGGDGVVACYAFHGGVSATFESRREQGRGVPLFGLTLSGAEGILSYRCDQREPLYFYPRPAAEPGGDAAWTHLDAVDVELLADAPPACRRADLSRIQQQALDLIAAVEERREPYANGTDGRAAVEMVAAVMESHRLGRRAPFPLANRRNPYEVVLESAGRQRQ
ncbi:MAG: Gfo/Idh/MocA family protein [Chloroflexota bacterium]